MRKVDKIFAYLKELYPDPRTELHYSTPFQLMMAVILSAQTTDKQVNKTTDILFKTIKGPEDLIKMGIKKFTLGIKSVNYYKTKAKNLRKLSQIVDREQLTVNNKRKDMVQELQKLPGIGEKSAKVVAHILYNTPVIAVDTHVHRVVNRLGLVTTKTPEETSKVLEDVVPLKYKDHAHHALVLFGRYFCTARNPKCEICKLKSICRYYKNL